MPLTKVLDLCCKHGILYRGNLEQGLQLVKLGSTGSILQENLRTEWYYNVVINKDYSMFCNSSNSFQETYNFAKNICSSYVPFGIAEEINCHKENFQEENSALSRVKLVDNSVNLRCSIFVPPSEGAQHFYQFQKQRRMWWRKISAMPGRYSFTDIQTMENKDQEVKIIGQYLWGKLTLETIKLHCNNHTCLAEEDSEVKYGRKKVKADYIVSDVCQSTMVLNAIYDAFEESTIQKTRLLFRFHRKMAPYKISFAIVQSSKETTDELNQLALYLCRKLRVNHISSLLLPSSSRSTLELQFQQYDELGVPYTILLNENTLKNGIAHIRSRDTTLKEQVHVADIPNYVEQLFKNY